MRAGYAAALALRWFMLPDTLRVLTGATQARRGRSPDEQVERAAQQFVRPSYFLLDRADEARELGLRLGLPR